MYGVFVAMSLALFALFSAFPAGRLYQAGLSINQKRSLRAGADNYSADMFGAAAGIIAVSLFFIPLLGFQVTGILVLLISVLTSAIGYFRISS
jgi:hypothetical protein